MQPLEYSALLKSGDLLIIVYTENVHDPAAEFTGLLRERLDRVVKRLKVLKDLDRIAIQHRNRDTAVSPMTAVSQQHEPELNSVKIFMCVLVIP